MSLPKRDGVQGRYYLIQKPDTNPDCLLYTSQAGIPHIGIHVLRHTFVSPLFDNKVDIKIVSRLLGHTDVGITYNTYIHLLKEDLPSATNTLDGILNAG